MTVVNLFILSFIVVCVIVVMILFLAIKRRCKTKKKHISKNIIATKNPLYFENHAEGDHHYEQ